MGIFLDTHIEKAHTHTFIKTFGEKILTLQFYNLFAMMHSHINANKYINLIQWLSELKKKQAHKRERQRESKKMRRRRRKLNFFPIELPPFDTSIQLKWSPF